METMEPLGQEQIKQESNYNLASVFERAIAFIIDLMLWATVSSLIYQIIGIQSVKIYSAFSLCPGRF